MRNPHDSVFAVHVRAQPKTNLVSFRRSLYQNSSTTNVDFLIPYTRDAVCVCCLEIRGLKLIRLADGNDEDLGPKMAAVSAWERLHSGKDQSLEPSTPHTQPVFR